MTTRSWRVDTVDGAHVRLRSDSAHRMRIDVRAPVAGGEYVDDGDHVRLVLRLALDRLRTGNFLTQHAARAIVARYSAHVLTFDGAGPSGTPTLVRGHAAAGTIDVDLDLAITATGPADLPLSRLDLAGSANIGRVDIPLPGVGSIEDFTFTVDARLAMQARP